MHFLHLVVRSGAELAGSVNIHFLNQGTIVNVDRWEQVRALRFAPPARCFQQRS